MRDFSEPVITIEAQGDELAGAVGVLTGLLRANGSVAVVQIAGPRGGEGASSIAVNVARAIEAGLGERSCVIHLLGAGPSTGSDLDAPGPRREYLGEEDCRAIAQNGLGRIVQRMSNNCRIFVVDSGPILTSPLSGFVADQVNGTILVMEARRTTIDDARTARSLIERGGGRVLGVLLNKRTYRIPGLLAWLLGLSSRPRRSRDAASVR